MSQEAVPFGVAIKFTRQIKEVFPIERIKVILMGLGSVGQGVTRVLMNRKGVEIVGALGRKSGVGKDLGEVANIGKQLGIMVTDDADSLFSKTNASVVIHATSFCPLREAYSQIVKPIEHGMNVIMANHEAAEPYFYDRQAATELERLAKKHSVTVMGFGGLGVQHRLVMAIAEQCIEVDTIKIITHVDLSRYPKEILPRLFGVGLTPDEYKRGVEEGKIAGDLRPDKAEIAAISHRLGWQLDEIKPDVEPLLGDDGKINGIGTLSQGIRNGKINIDIRRNYVVDPERGYYNEIIIGGMPNINAVIRYSQTALPFPGTVASLVNAIPHVVKARPGILTPPDLPLSFPVIDYSE